MTEQLQAFRSWHIFSARPEARRSIMESFGKVGALVSVALFTVAAAACSPASSGGGSVGTGGTTGGASGGATGGAGGANGSSAGGSGGGGAAAGSSGSAGQGSSTSSSGSPGPGGGPGGASGSGSGLGTTGDSGAGATDGGPSSARGCGQGTSCVPGSDLPPPATDQGIQIATPPGVITVQPGQEAFLCYYRTLPNTAPVNVGSFQSWMTPGSSHHFIAYQQGAGVLGSSGTQPDGTLVSCPFGGGTWLYATSLPGEIIEMNMPDGVGLPMPAGAQIMLNMHFINPGSTPVSPVVKLNLLYAQNVQYKAAAMVSFNLGINVPPATASGPGTQTVRGTCSAPVGSNFFVMTTHRHKHATATDVNLVRGAGTTNLVHTIDWEHPDVGVWNAPNFLTVQAGDSFTYSCAYSNSTSSPVVVGETAATNEMCMAIGYYFPAGNASCN